MANFLAPVLDYVPPHSLEPLQTPPLENLPFENGDADLFSFLDGLQPNLPAPYPADGGTGSKGVASSRVTALSGAPSWGLPAISTAFDPAEGVNIASDFQRRHATTVLSGLPGAEALADAAVAPLGAELQIPEHLSLSDMAATPSEGFPVPAGQWSMQDTFPTPSALAGYPNLQIHSMHTSFPAGAPGMGPLSLPGSAYSIPKIC